MFSDPSPLGEWMPDMPDLKFPNLITATNVEPAGLVYKSFGALQTNGTVAVPGGYVRGGGLAQLNGISYYYAYTDDGIFENQGGATFNARSATFLSAQVDFAQFNDIEIAATFNNGTLYHSIGAATNFATLGSATGNAPGAQRVGRINQFVLVGNTTTDPTHICWSGIGAPTSWPTPNSATATAQQSGEQFMPANLGEVTGFSSGDQFGLVFQESGITRVTYVGPPVVFQFDCISEKVGCKYPRSIVQVEGFTYFIGTDGIYKTDGVRIENVGFNKVNKYFLSSLTGAKERVYGAVNIYKKLIYWAYCHTSDVESLPSSFLIYNYAENRFTEANEVVEFIYGTTGTENTQSARTLFGLGANNTLNAFSDAQVAITPSVVQTGFTEINPGGFARVQGVKFLVDASATARACNLEYGNEIGLFGGTTISGLVTATASTGFSDFRAEARYHAPQFWSSAVFTQLQGVQILATPSGRR